MGPTNAPTASPTNAPTHNPTLIPTPKPSTTPSEVPTYAPTHDWNSCKLRTIVCVEQCDCCDSGVAIHGECNTSLVQHINICTGDGSYDRDPTFFVLESKSIRSGKWDFIQEGNIIFPNRENMANAGDTTSAPPRECVQIAVSMDKHHTEHRVMFPTIRGGDFDGTNYYPVEASGLTFDGVCN